MRPARIAALAAGALLLLVALTLVASGGFLLWAHTTQTDSSGYYQTSARAVSTETYALTTPDMNVDLGGTLGNWVPKGATAAMRIQMASTDTTPMFIGIGPTDQVSQYLANVSHDEVTNFGRPSGAIDYRRVDGAAAPSLPGQQTFWVAKQEGTGSQTLEWQVQSGNWTAVIMNGDATPRVAADVNLGARFGALLPIAVSLLAAGLLGLAVGVVLVILALRPAGQTVSARPPISPGTPALPQH